MSILSVELKQRGFSNQTTLEDLSALDNGQMSFYWGVDPSADSMQIGNLAAAMMVRHFIDHGHKAYLLIGGATGLIGDPDGKKDERNLLSPEEIVKNKESIVSQYKNVFSGKDFNVVDNYDWFKDISYLSFLRDVGKNVPLSNMLGREFVQSRLGEGGSGISYAEFSYSLIQGYDFLHLYREHGVTLQVCGADQWGNSIAGVDLIRRIEGQEAHVYSQPLIVNKATGKKFGKTEDGAIWLNEKKTSVYKFYQFWLNCDDEGVADYMKVYTLLSLDEIDEITSKHLKQPGKRLAQTRLAEEVTELVHGKSRLDSVKRVTEVLFGEASVSKLKDEDVESLSSEIPTVSTGKSVVEVLVSTKIAESNGAARRLIESGSIKINGEKIDRDTILTSMCLVKKGKNSFALVR